MKQLFTILFLIVGFVTAPPAAAGDLTISRAVLEDKAGTLTIADVAGREFKPMGPILSKGYSDSAYWVRLRVRSPAEGNDVVLFIRQPFLNEVRLFEAGPGDPGSWKTRVTGNHYPYQERDRARQTLGFVVKVSAPETTYYLRLKTNSQSQMSVEALTPEEADRKDHQLDLLEVFFVTSMVLLLIWAIHSYLLDRLPVVGLFAVHQAAYILFGVSVTGYLAPYLPAGSPRLVDLSSAISYCAVSFTTLLFCRELFRSYEPPPLLMRGLNLLLAFFPLQVVAMVCGYTTPAVMVNALLIRFSWWYFVVMTFSLRKEQSPSRRVLQIFFVVITIAFTLFWVAAGSPTAAKNSLFGRQILIINGIMIGGIFAMILNARSRRLLLEARQSAQELQAKSDFLALVSHEIRTPLNALVGFSSLARTATDRSKIDQYHAILEQSALSLMELVNGILDMSKIEAGRMEFEAVPFNLRQLVVALEEQYHPLADQKMLAFKVLVADNVPTWVLGDPVRLRQILANLLGNAVKFTESGEVSCTVSLKDRPVEDGPPLVSFAVRDTGIGIPKNKHSLLFKPFNQLDPTITRKYGGTGLGLAIVQSLTTLMKGCVTVDSREGEGSCFIVELPLQETQSLTNDHHAAPVVPACGTVLVAEDNEFNRRLLGDILISWGRQVVLAEDGRQALQFIEQQSFDLVLLDVRMPGIDGIEVARRIRRREQECSETPVPIIAITADSDAATCEACVNAGIDTVLFKPVIPEKLANAIIALGRVAVAVSPGEEMLLNLQISSDLDNNHERARLFRNMLLQDIADELQCLQTAFDREDRGDLLRAAHTLKGLCGYLANQKPAELAEWLQYNAESARPEQLRPVMKQLVQMCEFSRAQGD